MDTCPIHECTHSITEFARCGCNNTCNCVIHAIDTNCINVDIAGLGTPLSPYTVQATPVIDPDPNNTLTCGPAGLKAEGANVVANNADEPCQSVDVTVVEAPNNTFTVSAKNNFAPDQPGATITPQAPGNLGTNILRCLTPAQGGPGLGVFAEDIQDVVGAEIGPAIAGTCLTYDDATNKVNVAIADTPTTNGVKCQPGGLEVIPSTDAGNTTTLGADGNIFTPPSPTAVNVVDNAQNIDAVVGPPDTITFTCVPVPITTNTVVNAPCISVQGDTCNGFNIELGLSPDNCNGIECHGNGLFMQATQYPNAATTTSGCDPGPGPGNIPQTQFGPTRCTTITNPSTCRGMIVSVRLEYRDVFVTPGHTVGFWAGFGELSTDGGAIFGVWSRTGRGPSTGGAAYNDQGGSYVRDVAALPPGASATFCTRVSYSTGGGFNGNILSSCQILTVTGVIV